MTIKLTPRDGPAVCLYCRDDVGPQSVSCPACGVPYHDECAVTFVRCGILGCKAPLLAPSEARALPRLAAIAPRLLTFDAPAPEADDDWVVALLPGAGDDPARSAFVAGLLGGTVFDGRARVVSPVPEPLLRVTGRGAAQAQLGRLAERGLRGVALRAEAFLRPLLHVAAAEVEPLAVPLRYRTASGRERPFPPAADRLVITAQLIEERPREESSAARSRKRDIWESRTQRTTEHAALVFDRADPDPILLRRDGTRIHGLRQPTAYGRFRALVDAVVDGATAVDLKGSSSPMLLVRRRPIVDQTTENLAGVLLAARVLHAAWLAGA